ncbi:uncharacterized protein LOC143291303 [Babylonia areolata]|uniref:uncharacterized protein LOC143291303 n=1 Tax=Babylonia areolata TaxID=304850 RepID=UPI003FD1234A
MIQGVQQNAAFRDAIRFLYDIHSEHCRDFRITPTHPPHTPPAAMVRARTSRVVMSQRDVRQTTQPSDLTTTTHPHHHHHHHQAGAGPPPPPPPQPPASTSQHHHAARPSLFCTWCRANGRQYACLAESSHAAVCVDAECLVPSQDWARSAMKSEGWVPTSGPCCEDCLEAAFQQQRRKAEVGRLGRDLVEEVHSWCLTKGGLVRHSAHKGWKALCGWLERAMQRWRPPSPSSAPCSEEVKVGWGEVRYEAEGFLEVKVVVSRQGVMQHLEVDFPTEVNIVHLKAELATLIDVPASAQLWFYLGQAMDDDKTLEEHNVDIGGILEVKCRT